MAVRTIWLGDTDLIFIEKSLFEVSKWSEMLYLVVLCKIHFVALLRKLSFACLIHFCIWFSQHLLVILQYSLFGSILTIGAMIGAIVSGQIADYIGRRGVSTSPWNHCWWYYKASNSTAHQFFNLLVVLQGRQWAFLRYSAWQGG